MTDTERAQMAKGYDPEAFENHPVELRSHVAAIQWGARRHLAEVAADNLLGSDWLTQHDAKVRDAALEEALRPPPATAGPIATRTVTTIEELTQLPDLTVIRTAQGSIVCRHHAEIYTTFGDERGHYPWSALALPATVLHDPTHQEPTS